MKCPMNQHFGFLTNQIRSYDKEKNVREHTTFKQIQKESLGRSDFKIFFVFALKPEQLGLSSSIGLEDTME